VQPNSDSDSESASAASSRKKGQEEEEEWVLGCGAVDEDKILFEDEGISGASLALFLAFSPSSFSPCFLHSSTVPTVKNRVSDQKRRDCNRTQIAAENREYLKSLPPQPDVPIVGILAPPDGITLTSRASCCAGETKEFERLPCAILLLLSFLPFFLCFLFFELMLTCLHDETGCATATTSLTTSLPYSSPASAAAVIPVRTNGAAPSQTDTFKRHRFWRSWGAEG
jgi:hypothetical protein